MRETITPLIITFNEAPNIRRALDKLSWARRIVVVDSGSTDGTLDILSSYSQVVAIHHPFEDLASQWNFALAQADSVWVLSLDGDYEPSDGFIDEILSLAPPADVVGYDARFIYRIYGRPLGGTLYPPRTVLFRKDKATHRMDGHTQRVVPSGKVLPLSGIIYHDDRKPLSRWVASQQRYAHDEAEHLLALGQGKLSRVDRLRLIGWPAPFAVLFYVLFVKLCILDGWPGWFYALQRTIAEMLLALELADRRLRARSVNSTVTP